MKILKTVGYILLGLILLVLALGAIAPKEMSTSQSMVMNAAPATVFGVVNDLPSWERWSPWMHRDSTIKNEYSEKKTGAGAYYTWTSENSGAGQLTITDSYSPDSLHTVIDFDGEGSSQSNWYFRPVEGGTEVEWTFSSQFPFPFNAMLLFQDFKEMLDHDYKQGLELLKAEVESILPEGPALQVVRMNFPATRFVGKRETLNMADLQDHYQSVMPMVGSAVAGQGVEMTGAPAGVYYEWNEAEQTTDLFIAIPVADNATVDGLEAIDIPASAALRIDYVGNYDGLMVAHETMDAYLKANGLTVKLPVIESYLPDPGPDTEPDPNKWMTQLIYLIEE